MRVVRNQFERLLAYFGGAQQLEMSCLCADCAEAEESERESGWVRFGVRRDAVKWRLHDIENAWPRAYHGSTAQGVSKILRAGCCLLKSGDEDINRETVRVRRGHHKRARTRLNAYSNELELFDPNQVFLSPSLRCAALKTYAKVLRCRDCHAQFVLRRTEHRRWKARRSRL